SARDRGHQDARDLENPRAGKVEIIDAMTDAAIDPLRFPVGKFKADPNADMTAMIDQIAAAPANLARLAQGMTPAQWNTSYRPGGWTAAQVIHHLADSHANAYIRTRFALAEDNFTVKPYDEARWAEFIDAKDANVVPSLAIVTGLHERWVMLLRSLTPE